MGNIMLISNTFKNIRPQKIKTRRPAIYFPSSSFAKHTFWKSESVFCKKLPFSANFDKFSNNKLFLISAKKTSIQVKKRHFYKIISFNTHCTANLLPLTILKKNHFFSEKNPFFFSKPKFHTV